VHAASSTTDVLLRVLIALAAVIVTGQGLARILARFRQPPVIGEVIAGILLGPSLLGPDISSRILPPSVAPSLGIIAQVGVVLYMFLVGLELHLGVVRERAREIVTIAFSGIAVPFLLGLWIAVGLYARLAPPEVPFLSFSLFMGVAMAVTAFPVLARILADRGLSTTPLGVLALACAAVGDATAWCLLAFIVGVAHAKVSDGVRVAAGAAVYVSVMLALVRPLVVRLANRWEGRAVTREAAAVLFIALLVSAAATEAIGIHAIFGAFLLGAIVPHDCTLAHAMVRQLRDLVTVLLLPAFFAFAGMRTRIDLLSGAELWLMCGLIIVVATAGKFGGTFLAARLTGYGTREAAALGALMNTRGLMELIVLNIGLELGVISQTLFAMLVLMALVTTMATSPILAMVGPRR
jgi:K+:H+ antiporter